MNSSGAPTKAWKTGNAPGRRCARPRGLCYAFFVIFILLTVAAISTSVAGADYEWNDISRIVAVGDVHGAYDNLVAILKKAGLIDDQLAWSGGSTHLVQTGDVVDRGPDSRKCMELLMRLEEEAERAHGRVHVLIGNHETFNVVGVLDYVSPEEFASYVDASSQKRWEQEFKAYYDRHLEEIRADGRVMPPEVEVRKIFKAKYPLGYFEHRGAFGPEGRYGRWIRRRYVAVRLNGAVFSHGDWTEQSSALGLEEVNERVRDELSGKRPFEGGIIFDVQGPLQHRGLSQVPLTRDQQEAHRESVDRILANLKATRLVVGHTVTEGFIEPRFGGKHISIDVGMLDIYRGGHQVALEIEGNATRAIHPGGKIDLPAHLDESTLFDYLVAVAAVDPENVDVITRLAGEYRARGNLTAARDTLEQLFRIPKPVAFRYRQDLGDIYRELGEHEKARQQYLAYIEGLKAVIEVTPANPHLKNLLARFCLEHMLELNLAEQMIRRALRDQPDNPVFLLSLGRIQVLLRNFAEAAGTLERVMEKGVGGYETYYHLGLAYVGLKQTEKARQAFERALLENPAGSEAREELQKLGEPSADREEEARSHEE